jgi:O-acetyl-ADP-ribose deacetylase (regulator of RNase III)
MRDEGKCLGAAVRGLWSAGIAMKEKIILQQGDITEMDVDAIVNAANNDLQLGGGLAGVIRRKGGPSIQQECDAHGPVEVGEAAITSAGDLRARYVIHAASMSLGCRTTAEALRSSTRYCLRLAKEHNVRTIAFPAVGTGIAGFPLDDCADIMLNECVNHLQGDTTVETIYLVLFDKHAYDVFRERRDRL